MPSDLRPWKFPNDLEGQRCRVRFDQGQGWTGDTGSVGKYRGHRGSLGIARCNAPLRDHQFRQELARFQQDKGVSSNDIATVLSRERPPKSSRCSPTNLRISDPNPIRPGLLLDPLFCAAKQLCRSITKLGVGRRFQRMVPTELSELFQQEYSPDGTNLTQASPNSRADQCLWEITIYYSQ